jgi:predicted protein tyrosine phosphatase
VCLLLLLLLLLVLLLLIHVKLFFSNDNNNNNNNNVIAPLKMVFAFCDAANQWLDKSERNVLAIHCKAGKGRTGTMIACLLLDRYYGAGVTSMDILDFYGMFVCLFVCLFVVVVWCD